MTDTQTALGALDTLDGMAEVYTRMLKPERADERNMAVQTIRSALQSRTEQDPVAWRYRINIPSFKGWSYSTEKPVPPKKDWVLEQWRKLHHEEPLYTSPPDQSARIADDNESVDSQIAQELINWLVDHEGFDRGEELHIADVKPLLDDVISHYDEEIISKNARIAELEAEKREMLEALKPLQEIQRVRPKEIRGGSDVCFVIGTGLGEARLLYSDIDSAAALHNKLKEK